jgi:hypothetical protein
MVERGYDKFAFTEIWSIDKPVQRGKKKTASGIVKTRSAKKSNPRVGARRKDSKS